MGSYRSAQVRAWILTAALVALAACGDGVTEVGVTLLRTRASSCSATIDSSPRPMNTYQIDVLVDNREDPNGTCFDCLGDQRCGLVEQRCLCGADRAPSLANLQQALTGLRFDGLEQKRYCLRVVAVEVEEQGQQPTVETECACRESWFVLPQVPTVGLPPSPGRMCAVADQPLQLRGGASFELDVSCLDDYATSGPVEAPQAAACYYFPGSLL